MKRKYQISDRRKETWFSELHALLASGLDFSRAFRLLTEGEKDASARRRLVQLYGSVVNGHALWQSFAAGGGFTALDTGVLRIGEETGRLDESLRFLADYYKKKLEQRRMIIGAVSYPVVILVTAVVVLIFMILVIVPMFEQVYARMGGELPAVTRGMIAFSKAFPSCLAIIGALCVVFGGFWWKYGYTERLQSLFASLLLHIPVAGAAVRKSQQARFCRLLYLLYGSGVPLLRGIEVLENILTFYPYRMSFRTISDGLRRGSLFADCLEAFPALYHRKLVTLVRVGEETNRLGSMLQRQGEEFTRELEHELKQLGNLLEPLLILCVGGLVALVLVSMYLPMFKLGGIIG